MPTPRSPTARALRRDSKWLVVAAMIFLGVGLGARDLWNPNEPTYGRIVVETLEGGHWIVPQLNGRDFVEKPVLLYWMAAGVSHLAGGVSEVTVRLPVCLAGVVSTALLFVVVALYDGRRRAWLAAACFVTTYAVWFNARNAQMDSFVLLGTLGAVVPLALRLDAERLGLRLSGRSAWLVAGCGAGLGFAGKGPVSIVVPGLILSAYLVARRQDWRRLLPGLGWGFAVFLLLATPAYLLLWLDGRSDALHEMLLRQNFSRFVDAWDHDQPWWYYLKYHWMTFVPWSWLVPAAIVDGWSRRRRGELRPGERLTWLWWLVPLLFFSLSDSKREPYMLPAAPAIAWLAAGVTERLVAGCLGRWSRMLLLTAVASLGLLLTLAALALPQIAQRMELPAGLSVPLSSTVIAFLGGIVLFPLLQHRTRRFAPIALAGAFAGLYLLIALHLHTAVDPVKSSRELAERLRRELPRGAVLTSYLPLNGHVRGGYAFYLERSIPNAVTVAELESHWGASPLACVLWDEAEHDDFIAALPGSERRIDHVEGSRKVRVACKGEARS